MNAVEEMHDVAGRIRREQSRLMNEWAHAHSVWRDERGRHFNRHYLEPLDDDIKSVVKAAESLCYLLEKSAG